MRFAFLFTLLLLAHAAASGQTIRDEDRHPFEELGPIYIDVDGDGKPDRIQPRTYQTYKKLPGKRLLNRNVRNWITFDLTTSRGRQIRSFFTYNYGTAEQGGSYWVYSLVPGDDINKDGMTELIFYSGDDTSDETITLINKGNRFVVHSRKRSDSDDW